MTKDEAIKVINARLEGIKLLEKMGTKTTIDKAEARKKRREFSEALRMAIEALMTDIVRCGECRFSEEDYPLRKFPNRTEEQARQRWCDHSTYSHDKDFFCGYGERREE